MSIKKVAAYTLGCKVNLYDTQAMLDLLVKAGYTVVDFENTADVYIINTCTVTGASDKKSRQMIRRAVRKNPNAIIVVAGCYAQASADKVLEIDGVDIVLGTKDRGRLAKIIKSHVSEKQPESFVTDVDGEYVFEELSVGEFNERTRAFVKIQDGCDRFCSYCIIPYVRGPVRSRSPQEIIDEVTRLTHEGYKEFVLAGIHVASYGRDLPNIDLTDIITEIHDIEGVKRIRLSSIEPMFVNDKFLKAASSLEKLCNHFHLSLQSGSIQTLKAMNRMYTPDDYLLAVNSLKNAMPGTAFTTDIIAGFPGETDAAFEESLRFVESVGLSKIHVFPYSRRQGTPAADFANQIPQQVINTRTERMLALGDKLHRDFLKNSVNKEFDVLFEQECDNNVYAGYSRDYLPVRAASQDNLINKLCCVRISSVSDSFVFGEILKFY